MRGWHRAREQLARGWPQVALALMIFGSLYQALCHTEAFVDDAAISFSYSRQLAETGELVHTPSSERVEGFSNPTWTLLCAVAFLLRMDPFIFARAIGLMALAATILLAYRVGLRLCPRSRAAQLLAPLLQAMAPCVPFWTVAGLETPLVSLLVVLAIHQTLREEQDGASHRSGLVLAALALTRPEGIIYAAPVALYKLLRGRREGLRALVRRHMGNALLLAVPVLAYLLFRRAYFATWLPNTYHAKLGALAMLRPEVNDQPRGVLYSYGFFRIYNLWPVVFGIPLAFARSRAWAEVLLVVAFAVTHLAFVLGVNGDWMGDFRFFAMMMPVWALLLALVVAGAADLLAWGYGRLRQRAGRMAGDRPGRLRRAVAAALAAAFIVASLLPTLRDYARSGWVSMELVRQQGTGLELLARTAGLSRASVAIPDVGGSALHANVHVLDTVGLTDRVMARFKGRPDRIRQYMLEEARPDFYQEHAHWKRYYNLPRHFEFRRDYVKLPLPPMPDRLPSYIVLPGEQTKGLWLLGDNYIRREHLTGFHAEMDHRAAVDLGSGLRLVGYDDWTAVRGQAVTRLLVASDGTRPERGQRIAVAVRGPDGGVTEARSVDLGTLPAELFEAGALVRLRAWVDEGPIEGMRVAGPLGLSTEWLTVASDPAGERAGAGLEDAVIHPRSLLVCPPPPRRWSEQMHGRGRIQRFDGCRTIHDRDEVARLVEALHRRAEHYLDVDMPRPAILLLARAELLRPTSELVAVARRRAARRAYGLARAAAREGRLDDARALCVSALHADPQLARARSLYIRLAERGLPYSADGRARSEAARARLESDQGAEAQREALEALLAADRPLEAVRLLSDSGPFEPLATEARASAAEALLRVGLCEAALELLPEGPQGCREQWLHFRAAAGCGRPGWPPGCDEPRRDSPVVVLADFEGRRPLDGWQTSGPLVPPDRRELRYVSGFVGQGLLRTDDAEDGRWTGTSPEIEIRQGALSLQVAGSGDPESVTVSLVVAGEAVRSASGEGDTHLRRVTWDVRDLLGQRARLRVEDRDSDDESVLLVDHLRAHPPHLFAADSRVP